MVKDLNLEIPTQVEPVDVVNLLVFNLILMVQYVDEVFLQQKYHKF
jgi:hypothetical protein